MNAQQRRVRAAALQTARQQGCSCHPDITLTRSGALWRAQLAHDDDCPLATAHRLLTGVPTGPVVFIPPRWKAPKS